MGKLPKQDDRLLQVSKILGDDFLLVHASGDEFLSKPFFFETTLLSDQISQPLMSYICCPIHLTLHHENEKKIRHIDGVIKNIKRSPNPDQKGFYRYEIQVVPAIWKLALRQTKARRIFRNQTVVQIAQQIFKDHKLKEFMAFDYDGLKNKYKPSNYVVQLDETDLDFLHRIFSEEGVFYYFQHDAKQHKMFFLDNANLYLKYQTQVDDETETQLEQSILSWKTRAICQPELTTVMGASSQPKNTGDEKQKHKEAFHHQSQVSHLPEILDQETHNYVNLHQQVLDVAANQNEAVTLAYQLLPGMQFHRQKSKTDFLIAEAHHEVFDLTGLHYQPEDLIAKQHLTRYKKIRSSTHPYDFMFKDGIDPNINLKGMPSDYINEITMIPAKLCYRSEIISRPEIQGFSKATVVSTEDDKDLVASGSGYFVQVRFPWDMGDADNRYTDFIPVMTQLAGNAWGQQWTPRVGDEVIIHYQNNDIYQPIVTGAVYAEGKKPLYDPKSEPARTGIKTRSTPLTGTDVDNARSGNEICFDDAKKVAAINLFTAGDFDVRAEGMHNVTVDKDYVVLVERGDRKIKTEKGAIILEAEDQILLQSGKSTLCLTKDSVEIKSPKVHLNFSSVTSPENLKIKKVDQPKFDKADHNFARAATVVAIAKTDHAKAEAKPEFRDSAEQQALAESLDVSADISDVEAGLEIATSLFVEEIGVGEVEDADAVRRIAKASVERGEASLLEQEIMDHSELTDAQASRVRTIDNIIEHHAKPHDFEGVKSELSGEDTGYNHIQEMSGSVRGLKKSIRAISNSLKNPNLSSAVRSILNKSLSKAQSVLKRMIDTLNDNE